MGLNIIKGWLEGYMDIENNYAAVGECEYTFKEVFDGLESVFLAHSIKKDEYAEIKRRIFDFKFACAFGWGF